MQVPVYVISLKSATDRRENIKSQLDKMKISYKFVDAIDKKDLTYETLKKANISGIEKRLGRPFVPGEFACHLSHIKACHLVEKSKEGVGIIVEDDVIFDEKFKKICTNYVSIEKLPEDYICMLGMPGESYKKTVMNSLFRRYYVGDVIIRKTIGSTKYFCSSACCYLIKSNVAANFIRLAAQTPFLADEWKYTKEKKCFKGILLAVVAHHPDNWEVSDIENERKNFRKNEKNSLYYKLARFVYRKLRCLLMFGW